MARRPGPPAEDQQSRTDGDRSTWNQLRDEERGWLFTRLHNRVEFRAAEATEMRRLLGKILVSANAAGAAGTLAFTASVYGKMLEQTRSPHLQLPPELGRATFWYTAGLIASVILLMIVYARLRETLIKESEYLEEVIRHNEVINWDINPSIQRLGNVKYYSAAFCLISSVLCFIVGASYILEFILPGRSPILNIINFVFP